MGAMGMRRPEDELVGELCGVDILKRIWNITDKPSHKIIPPVNVDTDIYKVPSYVKPVPRRRRPR
jgi:hypothetical protein